MAISAKTVKELRDKTNAGMMDCKKALEEAGGDLEKAVEVLREKGIAKAAKKSGRTTNEGLIAAYIHPGDKLGVLVEVNCETDFVAKTDDFKNLVHDISMQVAAANPLVVNREELPQEVLEKEKQIYKTQALNEGKPEKIVDKIVEGRIEKYLKEVCLLEQPFIRDQDKSITDLLNETIATLGENITIKRFSRYRLGE
ncbi:MAG: translation elongation factor Ts [candidate division Zixibacteria bacterium]|nr:translation elongation factor Ts [candidate division Zixibacteria bacterium]NIR66415.1 translation elongation factor Ts [candidate division Zixibacteria bacterium]NIS18059.1 translation elongation factor Ts [candidate division Zixibacteria bacterium]NIS48005.1 translation elongation factor Ts [candidate division Zixibacteria bacterium]NIT54339.1 translation elongation factor Ts [candidate division Zixibacteria bacterium]